MYHNTWLSIVTILHAKGNKLCEKSWDLKEGKNWNFCISSKKREFNSIMHIILFITPSLPLQFMYVYDCDV